MARTYHTYNIYLDKQLFDKLENHLRLNPTVSRAKLFQHALHSYLDANIVELQSEPEPPLTEEEVYKLMESYSNVK